MQAAAAVLISVVFCLVLILLRRPFPSGFAYPEHAVSRWALYVCLLLAFWSLAGLFADWRNARKRERSIAGTSIPPSASFETEEGAREVIGAAQAAAARYGDSLLARRIEKAMARFQSSRNAAAAAEELAMDGDAALADLEAAHAPVRVFLYAIPILGFAGTVMGIRQTLQQAALSPSTAPQQLEAIKAALTRTTSSLAGSFDTALLALLLSLVVMVALTWVMEKEKSLLLAIDDFCRTRLLPLMQAAEARPEAREEALAGVLRDLRYAVDGMTRNAAGKTEDETPSTLAEVERQWAVELERLRGELSDAWSQHFELGKQDLEQRQATSLDLARRFDEVRELLSVRQETPATPPAVSRRRALAAAEPAAPPRMNQADAARPAAARVEELSATIEDLRDSIREMGSFLQRLSERLRNHNEEPVVVEVKMMPGTSTPAPDD
jgi:hypothetical protein